MDDIFVAIFIANLIAWLTPGPNMLAVIDCSIKSGVKHGIVTGLGLSTGSFFWAAISVAGVSSTFSLIPSSTWLLQLTGGIYLSFIGVKILLSQTEKDNSTDSNISSLGVYGSGVLISITNPKAALFFSAIFAAYIQPSTPFHVLVSSVVFCGVLGVILHSITAWLFSNQRSVSFFQRNKTKMNKIFGFLFIVFGATILLRIYN